MEDVRFPASPVNSGNPSPKPLASSIGPARSGSPLDREKSSSPTPTNERGSPEPNCAICLGKSQNKSFTDCCLHQFCFTCLLEWSKVKAECPLCKQSFKSIIHNVRSNEEYDQYHLRPAEPSYPWSVNVDARRFRYRTTMTGERQQELSVASHLVNGWFDPAMPPQILPSGPRAMWPRRRLQLSTSDFRQRIYLRDMWVQPLPDITGRYRECSPDFYRCNPAQIHRLVPWLNRELGVVMNNASHMAVALDHIISLLTRYPIRSREFRAQVEPYTGRHTDHFIHEFYMFATSPFDMIGFDQVAVYVQNRTPAVEVVHGVSSSSSDSDSDVQVVSPQPGPSSQSSRTPNHIMFVLSHLRPDVRPHLENSGSSSDSTINFSADRNSDSDDCTIVGFVKPRHERTPEVITLSSEPEIVEDEGNVTVHDSDSYQLGFPYCRSPPTQFVYEDVSPVVSEWAISSSDDRDQDSDFRPTRTEKTNVRKERLKKNLSKQNRSRSKVEKFCQAKRSSSSSSEENFCKVKSKRKAKGKKRSVSESSACSVTRNNDSDSDFEQPRIKLPPPVWRIMNHADDNASCSSHGSQPGPSRKRRPKLRSIVIARTAADSRDESVSSSHCSSRQQEVPSSSKSSHRHKHKKHKHTEKEKKHRHKKRSRHSSSDAGSSFVKERRKCKQLTWDSSS